MPTTTTTYSLQKPTVGGDTDVWGGLINDNSDKLDDILDGTLPITPAAGNDIDIVGTNAATNTVTTLLTLNSQSSGTPAAGIGSALAFAAETAAGNTEVGVVLEAVTTDVTAASEDFDLVIRTMAAGAAAAERLRVSSAMTMVTGALSVSGAATLNGTAIPASATLVSEAGTQTLTNKTLTSPVISTGISGTAIASTAEAQAGTDNTKLMTPLRVAESARPQLGTSVASTSGTAIDFTGIPSWAKRVTVMFSGVSLSGTSAPLVQLGTSGGVVITGYTSASAATSSGSTGATSSTAGLVVFENVASRLVTMVMTIVNISGNTWVSAHAGNDATSVRSGGGGVALSGTLDRIRITTVNGTDTFDAGTINIMWE